jgi:tetratricopeptide (TPR) repeat protein
MEITMADTNYSLRRFDSLNRKLFVVLCLVVTLLCPLPRFGTAMGTPVATASQQLLNQASYYYSVDDTSDRAADLYRQVVARYPTSPEAEQAQYYLGLYFHKKFYCLRIRNRIDDWSAFNSAEEALNGYIRRGSKAYLADTYFTLALIYLQRGNSAKASEYLSSMKNAAAKDPQVYVQSIVWTPNTKENINANCNTSELAAYSQTVIGHSFGSLVNELRNWCGQNGRKLAAK